MAFLSSCTRACTVAVAVVLIAAFAAPILEAQRTPTERARAVIRRGSAPRKQSFTADAGYVSTSGNTNVTTVNIGERYFLNTGYWRFEQFLAVVYGENDNEVNTNFIRAGIGGEYAIRPALGVAAGVLFDKNRFAGVLQRTEEYLGLVWRVVESGRDTLRLDVGGSITQQRNVDGSRRQFPAARSSIWYKHGFAEKAFVQQTVEVIPNLDTPEDYRINTRTALVSPVTKQVALRLEYQIRFENQPEPDFLATDRIFTTGFQVSF